MIYKLKNNKYSNDMYLESFLKDPDLVSDTLLKIVKSNNLLVDEPVIEVLPSPFEDLIRINVMWTTVDNGWRNRISAFLERKKLHDIAKRVRNV